MSKAKRPTPRKGKRPSIELITEVEQLRDWRDMVTLALQRDGGAKYSDVPDHIRALVGTARRYGELADAVIGPDRLSVEDRDFWTHEMSVKEANNLRQNDHLRALGNCYVTARRELRRLDRTGRVEIIHGLDTTSVERWQHIARFCEEAGCRLNPLRATLPTELTEGEADTPCDDGYCRFCGGTALTGADYCEAHIPPPPTPPDTVPSPLQRLRELLDTFTQNELAKSIGVSPQFLCDVMHGRREVTESLASKLGYQRVVVFMLKPAALNAHTEGR